jgi:hypothetical protein
MGRSDDQGNDDFSHQSASHKLIPSFQDYLRHYRYETYLFAVISAQTFFITLIRHARSRS